MATRGFGAICMESTAVLPEGRTSPEDAVSDAKLRRSGVSQLTKPIKGPLVGQSHCAS